MPNIVYHHINLKFHKNKLHIFKFVNIVELKRNSDIIQLMTFHKVDTVIYQP